MRMTLEDCEPSMAADIVIVGGGLAGLFLAEQLRSSGKRIVVLESGSAAGDADFENSLNEVEYRGSRYGGAEDGRRRGFGGTSQIWGGAMLPFQTADLRGRGELTEWPIDHAELERHIPDVERFFSLPDGPYRLHEAKPNRVIPGYHIRMAKWPAFKNRNVFNICGARLKASVSVRLVSDATTVGFEDDRNGRIIAVEARSRTGKLVRIAADKLVVASGAIESTRLLLLLQRRLDARLSKPQAPIGNYLHDHLSAPVATLDASNRTLLNKDFAFRFGKNSMRTVRFERDLLPQDALPAAFCHISFLSNENSSFAALRAIYQAVQGGKAPALLNVLRLLTDAPWLARAVWWRFVHRRLLTPSSSAPELHLVTEQAPVRSNRILLSDDSTDALGVPRAAIEWKVGGNDVAAFRQIAENLLGAYSQSLAARYGKARPTDTDQLVETLARGSGIYHPGGTTRMGTDPRESVVDGNLKVHGTANLFVLSTSTFPTGGGSNPSMTLLLLANRLANRLAS